jgi:hypothetical protein
VKTPFGTEDEQLPLRSTPWERIAVLGFLREHYGEPPLTKEERHLLHKTLESEGQSQ